MATSILFDTLSCAKKLKAGGFSDLQAETQAMVFAEMVEPHIVATKSDIDGIKTELNIVKNDIHKVETRLLTAIQELELRNIAKFGEMKVEIIRWVIGAFAAQAALFASISKFLH